MHDLQRARRRRSAAWSRRRARWRRKRSPTCSSPARGVSACRCRASRASARACGTRNSRRSRSRTCCCARPCQIDRAAAGGVHHAASACSSPAAAARSASEICARVVAFGASDLLVLESSEPALHQILENPALLQRATPRLTASSPTCATARASAQVMRRFRAGRSVPRRRSEARALSREGLDRGHQDQRVRLGQRRRRRASRRAPRRS